MSKRTTFWTTNRVARLVMWYGRFCGKPDAYQKVADKLKTTKSAVYKKLGRLGHLDAKWAKSYTA